MVSWSGSAALGGILVDRFGILFNFCFTAGLQLVATGPLLLLSFYDRREEEEEDERQLHREGAIDALFNGTEERRGDDSDDNNVDDF
eukprot:CAMPEP_0201276764 /NCGR_PEP_ID=MMETSP0853-20130426/57173_1 /ASSEMBLY_ACC=CAM_ASM_000640 /TAXON_ID=183588 /ORGANISM="Pseudo-nitzschia fraudulenta, Strain WWA7" /LENGTH=86 /DNA_ID=CAMNT_0047584771 /DNA_START=39 /DNA_END=299 /DNA_ORIENTATION=+